jgi:hypothetical protein
MFNAATASRQNSKNKKVRTSSKLVIEVPQNKKVDFFL